MKRYVFAAVGLAISGWLLVDFTSPHPTSTATVASSQATKIIAPKLDAGRSHAQAAAEIAPARSPNLPPHPGPAGAGLQQLAAIPRHSSPKAKER